MMSRYFSASAITAVSLVNRPMTWTGNSRVTRVKMRPAARPNFRPTPMMRRMGTISFLPQYCAPSTDTPAPTPKVICWSMNCTWLTRAAPDMAVSL